MGRCHVTFYALMTSAASKSYQIAFTWDSSLQNCKGDYSLLQNVIVSSKLPLLTAKHE